MHRMYLSHPFYGEIPVVKWWAGPGWVQQSGAGETVKQVAGRLGPSERMTVDFSDLDASTLNIVNGESGEIFSPYFNDQWQAWYHGKTFPLPFTKAAVDAATAHNLTLEPTH